MLQVIARKPSYEIGTSAKLSLPTPVTTQGASSVSAVWRLDTSQLTEDDLIDPDVLLDAADLVKPDPSSLKVSGWDKFCIGSLIDRKLDRFKLILAVETIIQSTPLNRTTSVRGHFGPIKSRTLLTENMLY